MYEGRYAYCSVIVDKKFSSTICISKSVFPKKYLFLSVFFQSVFIQSVFLRNVPVEAVRPYSTKPGTQEMSLMALTLYFLTQTLYTKYQIEERPPLE